MKHETPAVTFTATASGTRSGGWLRWMICALLLFGAVINYIDRQVIGILKPTLVETFGWSDERIYASIIFAFQLAYAIGFIFFLPLRRLRGRDGTRTTANGAFTRGRCLSISGSLWNGASRTMATGLRSLQNR